MPLLSLRVVLHLVFKTVVEEFASRLDDLRSRRSFASRMDADHIVPLVLHPEVTRVEMPIPRVVVHYLEGSLDAVLRAVNDRVLAVVTDATVIAVTDLRLEPPFDRRWLVPLHEGAVEDFASGVEIQLGVHRRHGESLAVVVEATGCRLLREARYVEIDSRQIADRVAILIPVEPPQHDLPISPNHFRPRELLGDPIDHFRDLVRLGLRLFLGRHLVAVENIHDLAPFLFGRLVEEVGLQMPLQMELALLLHFTVATDAVLFEERHDDLAIADVLRGGGCRQRLLSREEPVTELGSNEQHAAQNSGHDQSP